MEPVPKETRIGLYGGSFDPIHLGHLNLAISLMEARKLAEVWFIPARCSPHKSEKPPANGEQRKAMLEQAVIDFPGARVLDLELQRAGPSYSIDTVNELQERYPGFKFEFLIGEDAVSGLHHWKDIDILLRSVPFIVGSRRGASLEGVPDVIVNKIKIVETPLFEMSASSLRQRLAERKYCGHLIPQKVLDYIDDNGLYSF